MSATMTDHAKGFEIVRLVVAMIAVFVMNLKFDCLQFTVITGDSISPIGKD